MELTTFSPYLAAMLFAVALACSALSPDAAAAWQQSQQPQPRDRSLGLGAPTPKDQKGAEPRGAFEAGRPELVVQTGHGKRADGLAFSPDGLLVATSGDDALVKIWNAAAGQELRSLALGGPSRAVAFSPDGARLAAGSFDGQIKIWDVSTGSELRSLKISEQSTSRRKVNALAFAPDGRWLASAGNDGTARIWDTSSGAEAQALKGHASEVLTVAFSADGSRISSGSRDGAIKVWEAASGRVIATLNGHAGAVASVAFSADGKRLASGGADTTVRVWDVERGEARTLAGRAGDVLAVAFSADGRQLFSAAADRRSVRVWDAATGSELGKSEDATAIEKLVAAAFSPDRRTVAASAGDKNVSLREVARVADAGRTLSTRTGGVYAVAFSPDGKWFASGGKDNAVKLWETATGRQLSSVDARIGWTTALAFSPDSRLLVAGGLSGGIKVWEIESARELPALGGHAGSVNALAFRADGLLASAGGDGAIKLWDAARGRLINSLEGHPGGSFGLAFSPDGKRLASGGADKMVRLWDVDAGAALQTLPGHADIVRSVAFSADGLRVASASRDRTIKIWDAAAGSQVGTLPGNEGFTLVAYDPAGRRLLTGSASGRFAAFDASTLAAVYARDSHTAEINGVSFSRGGQWLATASEDGSLRLWDAGSGELAATLISASETNDWLVAAPDGLFDGSPEAWDQILWRFDRKTTQVRPVEVFFNEFYYPGLLADIFAGKHPRAEKDIVLRDRRQPRVSLSAEAPPGGAPAGSAREVSVSIEIEEAVADGARTTGSGARGLRLFRNGLLVKAWHGDVLGAGSGCKPGPRAGSAVCRTSVPVVAGENRLTSYAFNRDNVKSADAELSVRGDDSLRRRGTAYILAVGLNDYANKYLKLRFARADAEAFGAEVRRARLQVGDLTDIEVVPLYDADATKANILYALSRLAGSAAPAPPPGVPPALERLKPAQPEDTVFIYYAGHGVAVSNSFYLIPHDPGYAGAAPGSEAELQRILKTHFVSDRELETALEGIDAAQIVLVLDACNSGQALDAEDSRRGPMNTKGLAQLAYEKGMFILTASQSFQSAMELAELGHGLLTYALVVQGLEQGAADAQPHDGQIMMGEWLDYATDRVPRMQAEKIAKRRVGGRGIDGELQRASGTLVADAGARDGQLAGEGRDNAPERASQTQAEKIAERGIAGEVQRASGTPQTSAPDERGLQRPRVFYRKELALRPLIVSKFGAAATQARTP